MQSSHLRCSLRDLGHAPYRLRRRRRRRTEDGQSLAEYTFILALIALGAVAVLTQLGAIVVPWLGGLNGAL
jgi:Flp pilus assembly pilin Flp